MKWSFILCIAFVISCSPGGEKIPDVSGVQLTLPVQRFDSAFFSLDTSKTEAELSRLQQGFGSFLNDYLYNILALPPQQDSLVKGVKSFIRDYRFVYDTVQDEFPSMKDEQQAIMRGLKFARYYFPGYKVPGRLITFVGPLEGYSSVITQDALAVGLQLYLGMEFPAYHSEMVSAIYPDYQQRKFKPEYVPVDCMKNVVNDIYPEKSGSSPLVYQMIDAGKRLYMLDHFLPEISDTLKTGYTKQQLDGCYENEALIWNFFVQNNLLFITDPIQVRDYMTEGPRTEALGPASPGFIGKFIGWQIVKKWMDSHTGTTLEELVKTDEKQIYEEARYKPK